SFLAMTAVVEPVFSSVTACRSVLSARKLSGPVPYSFSGRVLVNPRWHVPGTNRPASPRTAHAGAQAQPSGHGAARPLMAAVRASPSRSEEHTSELQSLTNL